MIQSIKEILEKGPVVSAYTGSEKSRDEVASQIKSIWGASEVKNYNPYKNALTFTAWLNLGYRPKKGSKALKSTTFIEKKDAEGKVVSKYPRTVNLFYYRQVEEIKKS